VDFHGQCASFFLSPRSMIAALPGSGAWVER
jgi:hypothetical protein